MIPEPKHESPLNLREFLNHARVIALDRDEKDAVRVEALRAIHMVSAVPTVPAPARNDGSWWPANPTIAAAARRERRRPSR